MINKTTHLAVLGSTRGTDLEAIIEAIAHRELDASIEIVISNKKDAYILKRARQHRLPAVFINPKNKTRETFDRQVMDKLAQSKVELVLLIGYMRIISPAFVKKWRRRIINVHPSLLPAFAGGMDLNVHQAVLAAGVKETGCTVHLVDEGVDSGPIIVQKKCRVASGETAESLKAKIQKLEGDALIKAIKMFQAGKLG